ncbi:MAG: RNA methyltransferase [Methanobacteriota archaeon]
MPSYTVVLVEPRFPGNVGSVARAMANFGLDELVLVRPCAFTDETWQRALHARPIVEKARVVASFREALEGVDVSVATTGIVPGNPKRHGRDLLPVAELAERVAPVDGRVGLVFGREDDGLRIEEIEAADLVVTVPTSADYPSMNLSHAAAVVFYELYRQTDRRVRPRREAARAEKERFYATFEELLDELGLPGHRVENTRLAFRRVVGRATLSTWEFHRLMGVFVWTLSRLRGRRPPGKRAQKGSR